MVFRRLLTLNAQVGRAAIDDAFVPYIFIGVCDGCRFGGNDQCVNRLDRQAHMERMPEYWVTDHFENSDLGCQISRGGTVKSLDEAYNWEFEKLALLSSSWGKYNPTLGGATLFKVNRRL